MLCELHNMGRLTKGVLSDSNQLLMELYRTVKKYPLKLVDELTNLGYKNNRSSYIRARSEFNELRENTKKTVRVSALLIYLNRHSYNGLWRVNSTGDYNVPFGDYKNPHLPTSEKITAFSDMLRKVQLRDSDFADSVRDSEPGDLVYFDPPYFPVSETADFTSYTPKGFLETDQERLLQLCLDLDGRGVKFMLSNSNTEKIRELFSEFNSTVVPANRNINSKGGLRKGFTELVVMNYKLGLIPE